MKKTLYTLVFLFVNALAFGQDTLFLANPSFEDTPRMAKAPKGWYDCGFPTESQPDIHSDNTNFFDVKNYPSDGTTYIGMVVRDNDTWEMIGQRLPQPLNTNVNYHFSVDLCRANSYVSFSRTLGQEVNYTSPVKLRVWGGSKPCDKKELLAETPLIINTRWLSFDMVMTPTKSFEYLVFECFYKTPSLFPYNGNLLMDNISPIVEISSEMADSLAALSPKKSKLTQRDYIARETPQLTAAEIDSIDTANRQWATAGNFTEAIHTLLVSIETNFDEKAFSNSTNAQLKQLLRDLRADDQYSKVILGILGDKKRRKQLSKPVYDFMEENGMTTDQLKIVKVPIGDLDENWVGKNKYYRIRLE